MLARSFSPLGTALGLVVPRVCLRLHPFCTLSAPFLYPGLRGSTWSRRARGETPHDCVTTRGLSVNVNVAHGSKGRLSALNAEPRGLSEHCRLVMRNRTDLGQAAPLCLPKQAVPNP